MSVLRHLPLLCVAALTLGGGSRSESAPPRGAGASPSPRAVSGPATWPSPPPLTTRPGGPTPRTPDGWYTRGVQARRDGDHAGAAQAFAQAAALNPSAANWRALADAQVALGDYAAATRAYGEAAARYRAGGDDVTARAVEFLASPYRQELQVMLETTLSVPTQPRLARLEPARGLLPGIHVGPEGVTGAWGQPPVLARELQGFPVAFRYWKLSRSADPAQIFPGRFARAARASGQALHLALEPGLPLAEVSDAVIQAFVREARAADVPLFIRFASEMNDPKNEWSRDPALYRRTFARLAAAVHAGVPRAAMVWMPMPGDLARMAAYYPGAGAVDWAGLSLYSVPFENGDTARPRLGAHPLEQIGAFYRTYAPHHPLQLSEYAASHRSGAAPGTDFGDFARQQLREVYWGARARYPRLKSINWLDLDMHTSSLVRAGNPARRNDYRLLAVPGKWSALQEVLAAPGVHRTFAASQCADCPVGAPVPWPGQVGGGQSLNGSLWVQAAQPVSRVDLRLDGQPVPVGQALPYRFSLPALLLGPGAHRLQVRVLGPAGRVLMETAQAFAVKGPQP